MERIPLMAVLIWTFLLTMCPMSNSVEDNLKQSLVQFMDQLSEGNANKFGWNKTSDPCTDSWVGLLCDSSSNVRKIVLEEFHFTGIIDAASLCMVNSLVVLSLRRNYIVGLIPDEIVNCKNLRYFSISSNRISGPIPDRISQLTNLRSLYMSNNLLSGKIPALNGISRLMSFHAQGNQLTGTLPNFNFTKLVQFNVSNNMLTGRIPDILSNFSASSFSGNAGLCGKPINPCPPSSAPAPSPYAS